MRRSPQRATRPPPPARVTSDEVRVWLEDRLAVDPALRRSIKRVLAALRKAETAVSVRRRRAG
jgi:hypothetical protein